MIHRVLTQRARDLWKIWMRSPFIRLQKNGQWKRIWYLFWIIFRKKKLLLFLDELNHLAENGEGVEEEYRQSRMHREEKGEANLPEQWLCGFQEVQKKLNRNCVAVSSAFHQDVPAGNFTEEFNLTVKSVRFYTTAVLNFW